MNMRYKKSIIFALLIFVIFLSFGCILKKANSINGENQYVDHNNDPLVPSSVDIDTLVYEDKEGDVLYNIAKVDQVILPEKYIEKHNKMVDVIDAYNKERDIEAKKFIDDQKNEIRSMRSERNDDTLMLSYEDVVVVNRIDDVVFSFAEDISNYTGGAHGYYATIGRNYKAKDGVELVSDDVFTDKNKLKTILIDRIKEDYGEDELFPEWEDTLKTHFEENKPFNILVGTEFVDVIFDHYYLAPWSTGEITITLPYNQYSDILNKKYFK